MFRKVRKINLPELAEENQREPERFGGRQKRPDLKCPFDARTKSAMKQQSLCITGDKTIFPPTAAHPKRRTATGHRSHPQQGVVARMIV